MKTLLCAILLLTCSFAPAQTRDPLEGLFQGYDGEWRHVTHQLVELAEAIPAEKYAWRPAEGVRSTGEVFMHIVTANYYLLGATGVKAPAELESLDIKKIATDKTAVISWLKRSQEAVEKSRASVSAADFQRKVTIMKRDATVEAIYLRILIHNNEHMGQLIAYARMNGITPPWSRPGD